MTSPIVHVVRTGTANLASVCAALRRAGVESHITESREDIASSMPLVVPGVGTLAAAMDRLQALDLVGPLRTRVRAGLPTLGVCLGFQMLFETSAESPGTPGLGVIAGHVGAFKGRPDLVVPHMGWNSVLVPDDARIIASGFAYFANSYRVSLDTFELPGAWRVATCDYAGRFIAAIEHVTHPIAGCQFHPELSGPFGRAVLSRWLAACGMKIDTESTERETHGGHGEENSEIEEMRQTAPSTSSPLPHASTPDLRVSSVPSVSIPSPPPPGLRRRVIPCLDVKAGRVVKGVKFQNLRDAGDPVEAAARYAAEGADELVVLDVSATPEARANAAETVAAVRAVLDIPLTVGGGVRTIDDARRLLDVGADKVGVNTAAVRRPELVRELAETFGRQCTVVAIDAARREDNTGWEVVVTSGTERTGIDAVEWARTCAQHGAGEILLTSWDRDGTGDGYDVGLLAAVCQAVTIPVIASGGAKTTEHLVEGLRTGATAVLAATIFHDRHTGVDDVKRALRARGVSVRED